MSTIRDAFPGAAAAAAALLAEPAVAEAWDRPSALPLMSVSGLAGHLAAQVLHVPQRLDAEVPDEQPIGLLDHYARVRWMDAKLEDDINISIRDFAEEVAAEGPAALAAQIRSVAAALPRTLAPEPADRLVHLPWGPWSLELDDFLITRMMEIAVHNDDLAISVGVDTPLLPDEVMEPVLHLLRRLAERRHGPVALLRAFSRAERAPQTIAAF